MRCCSPPTPHQGASVTSRRPSGCGSTSTSRSRSLRRRARVRHRRRARGRAASVAHPDGDAEQRRRRRCAAGLGRGVYTATYRVVSADGHPVSGGFSFGVGGGRRARSATRPTVADLLARIGRRAARSRPRTASCAGCTTRRCCCWSARVVLPVCSSGVAAAAPAGRGGSCSARPRRRPASPRSRASRCRARSAAGVSLGRRARLGEVLRRLARDPHGRGVAAARAGVAAASPVALLVPARPRRAGRRSAWRCRPRCSSARCRYGGHARHAVAARRC